MQPDPQLTAQLGQCDSATVANAIEHFAVRDPTTGYADNRLVCQRPEIARPMTGYAITCTADTTTPNDCRTARVGELIDHIAAAPKPAVLVIQHRGRNRDRACFFGDMFCAALDRIGCTGLVTDGNGRDLVGIRARTPNFHAFSAGWVVSHGYPVYLEFNIPVEIYGLTVTPGDLLHGDHSGLVSVPREIAADVAARALDIRREEADYFAFLGGDFSLQALKQRLEPRA